jgi:hypothetical protein
MWGGGRRPAIEPMHARRRHARASARADADRARAVPPTWLERARVLGLHGASQSGAPALRAERVGRGHRSVLDKAIEVLHRTPPRPGAGTGTDDIFFRAYADADFRGASIFGDLPQGWIYLRDDYVGNAMNDAISSLTVTCTSNEAGGNAILFEHASFVGKYQSYGVLKR